MFRLSSYHLQPCTYILTWLLYRSSTPKVDVEHYLPLAAAHAAERGYVYPPSPVTVGRLRQLHASARQSGFY